MKSQAMELNIDEGYDVEEEIEWDDRDLLPDSAVSSFGCVTLDHVKAAWTNKLSQSIDEMRGMSHDERMRRLGSPTMRETLDYIKTKLPDFSKFGFNSDTAFTVLLLIYQLARGGI